MATAQAIPHWKMTLWERDTVAPAMLRGPLVVIFFLGLWTLNVWVFEKCRIPYTSVLPHGSSPVQFLVALTLSLTVLYTVLVHACLAVEFPEEVIAALFYSIMGIAVFVAPVFAGPAGVGKGASPPNSPRTKGSGAGSDASPASSATVTGVSTSRAAALGGAATENAVVASAPVPAHTRLQEYWEQRASFLRLLKTVLFPGTSISFPEIVLADALTSLSKVFKDVGVTFVAVYAYTQAEPVVVYHEQGMLLVALMASMPAAIRVRQCWVQLTGASDSATQIAVSLNIIKYCSAFPPIWLAAAASLGYPHPALPAAIVATSVINSVYSYLWDVMMDWGLVQLSVVKGRVCLRLRPLCFYPTPAYIVAAALNLVLRFGWMANQVEALQGLSVAALVLMVEMAEVSRRAVWNLFRVEWEIINTTLKEREATKGDDEFDYAAEEYTHHSADGGEGQEQSSGSSSSVRKASLSMSMLEPPVRRVESTGNGKTDSDESQRNG